LYIIPTFRTIILSFYDRDGEVFVGLANYISTFDDREMWGSFRNTILWIVIGTGICVSLGLFIAVLADRSKYETLARTIVFTPMAISFIGAAVIFRFIYYYAPEGAKQIGLLNAIVTSFGGQPQAWLQYNQPWNNVFLIIVAIWMQTGFCMVIFSAALKGVPDELLEAARIDGANERRIFFSILIPYIWGTIVTVTTTIIIFMLKIFDLVMGMTGGQFSTDVIGTQFYRQLFANRNLGWGAAIATLLLVAVIPVMAYNLRQLAQNRK
jgi:alpha-glucoside transport system permease protein